MKKILVTGAAGFIGFHCVKALIAQDWEVIGVDNMNSYYDVMLKQDRIKTLSLHPHFEFHEMDISNREALAKAALGWQDVTHVLHLAAQAGVRYSIENPYAYVESNLVGHLNILEYCRFLPNLTHLVYASSSSVYGGNNKTPFSVDDPADHPVSFYAATKRADELMTESYSRLYNMPATGLRFFTVYGPYGRPDMAYYTFTRDIINGNPITLFNGGLMKRDFTYIDDVVQGVISAIGLPPQGVVRHRLFNLGNNKPVALADFVAAIEKAADKKADIITAPIQPGDVVETYADIESSRRELGYEPVTDIETGIARFVEWYKNYYHA